MRRLRGVVAGLPDNLVVQRRKRTGCMLIAIELKSPSGKCTSAQREVRKSLLRSGCRWFECRSANAAMVAIAACGVRFRTIIHADGTVERWKKPRLADWEKPRSDPSEPRPPHPEVAAQRRAARQRWRERRQRARETSNDALLSPSAAVASSQAQRKA
jgi:hypothetical protein